MIVSLLQNTTTRKYVSVSLVSLGDLEFWAMANESQKTCDQNRDHLNNSSVWQCILHFPVRMLVIFNMVITKLITLTTDVL